MKYLCYVAFTLASLSSLPSCGPALLKWKTRKGAGFFWKTFSSERKLTLFSSSGPFLQFLHFCFATKCTFRFSKSDSISQLHKELDDVLSLSFRSELTPHKLFRSALCIRIFWLRRVWASSLWVQGRKAGCERPEVYLLTRTRGERVRGGEEGWKMTHNRLVEKRERESGKVCSQALGSWSRGQELNEGRDFVLLSMGGWTQTDRDVVSVAVWVTVWALKSVLILKNKKKELSSQYIFLVIYVSRCDDSSLSHSSPDSHVRQCFITDWLFITWPDPDYYMRRVDANQMSHDKRVGRWNRGKKQSL